MMEFADLRPGCVILRHFAAYKLVTDLQSFTLMMASAQVVQTSVNTNNSPSQDYTTNPDDLI